ncbi:3-keto-disaccharide hydrolase [Maribacter ulvicola]|uniref:3-keto-alpha-glucoside-1,2-lyase/3-keto-2-hydroxy-glucal hydratase domain-containing protein n=1 Tax=Maribacter ulvicola TaxID=228959 RepID=A0A1N6ZXJ9_9FLAO|nr:DUF1080 domain-containing protein [Maribacter ulvicola]SIR31521.1 protein of unknown function [Maribacter ulvicola]
MILKKVFKKMSVLQVIDMVNSSIMKGDRVFANLRISLPILVFLGTINLCAQSKVETISLFDGVSMDGWKVLKDSNSKYWKVLDSTLVGGDNKVKIHENTYLYTVDEYEDFEFSGLFKITGDHKTGLINSGIQYRSSIKDGHIIGYQADIGKGYWGDIYDEHRRGKLVSGDLKTLKNILNENGWNSYLVRCIGNTHELYINGVKTAYYKENDANIPSKGVIGIQLHSGGKAKVEFKHLTVTPL